MHALLPAPPFHKWNASVCRGGVAGKCVELPIWGTAYSDNEDCSAADRGASCLHNKYARFWLGAAPYIRRCSASYYTKASRWAIYSIKMPCRASDVVAMCLLQAPLSLSTHHTLQPHQCTQPVPISFSFWLQFERALKTYILAPHTYTYIAGSYFLFTLHTLALGHWAPASNWPSLIVQERQNTAKKRGTVMAVRCRDLSICHGYSSRTTNQMRK